MQAQEWVYFHQGTARVTVFIGGQKARTFDFRAGDTGVFPTNSGKLPQLLDMLQWLTHSGHYIENTSETEELVWIENFKSDTIEDISLTQWLALTPHDIVANVLKIPVEIVDKLKTEKQILIKGN